ncbi:glycosyl transferase family 90 [Tateyamaria sp. SN6-1]|uniref:glycosyl transferase family 90 n=1 Tax=Tateyamaria sp. SN6-1 TaxID=3092148 RepID=UPI0039F52D09
MTASMHLGRAVQWPYRTGKMHRNARKYFAGLGLPYPSVRIAHSDTVKTPYEMHLIRDADRLDVLVDLRAFRETSHSMKHRACAYWHWFAQAPNVPHIICDVSDGHRSGFARFAYSTFREDVVPLPDFYFFRDRGYADSDAIGAAAPDWDDRSDDIIWRGRPNSQGLFTTDPAMARTPGVMQRLRMAMLCAELDGVDFRFVGGRDTIMQAELEAAGLIGDPVPQDSWAGRKYAIDIDGVTNAWDNLLRRLKMGCCVLKVDSPFGFRQWYYDQLVPFEHFVPIRADLSDLEAQVDWVRSNPAEAREIARAGQSVARALTFESETAAAGRLIETHA